MEATAVAAPPRAVQVSPERFKLAEYDRNNWIINCEEGHTIRDCLEPGYWAHIAQQLNPYDHIEARAEDGAWVCEFIVLACDRSWAKVQLLWECQLASTEMPKGVLRHEAAWKGPQRKWVAIRLSDRQMLKEGMNSRQEALDWIRQHEQAIST